MSYVRQDWCRARGKKNPVQKSQLLSNVSKYGRELVALLKRPPVPISTCMAHAHIGGFRFVAKSLLNTLVDLLLL